MLNQILPFRSREFKSRDDQESHAKAVELQQVKRQLEEEKHVRERQDRGVIGDFKRERKDFG